MAPKRVIFGLLGTTLDAGRGPKRWERWRPTVSLTQHEDLVVDRVELLYPRQGTTLAKQVAEDIALVSPGTEVRLHLVDQRDPWDFEEVYTALHDFAASYPFDQEGEEYLVHITTGTHVAQICLFLLTESRRFPATLIQTSPKFKTNDPAGEYRIIDLDLSRYDTIAARFHREFTDNIAGLKSGIPTRNAAFNRLIEELEHVAANSVDPILLSGPTGAGKSQLARRIYELKKHRRQVEGAFVEVNCATLRGDAAMSTLFGHKKGAFTGATTDRAGLLKSAHGGILFLDEIGELGVDEQAMLLRALEERRFLPLGSDVESTSAFQLIAGSNRDLIVRVNEGHFREDLLARINLWTFGLPALRDRREDIEPNLEYELAQFARRTGRMVRFTTEARNRYLRFATGPDALWRGNFRDLSASVTRMATLSPSGRISEETVTVETGRLAEAWRHRDGTAGHGRDGCAELLGAARAGELDRFDRVQLEDVLSVCRSSRSISEAGRTLFAVSRTRKASVNDADRLRKYLARFGITWEMIAADARRQS
ncbi:MAG: RNA repair transcriptional activator RtcR [Phycisphaerales bacterium]|nr:RNA repair transcriptional activator RtcR [Phycisphaerales bacterium]